jgi:glycosyltransferase involved in cell wall biosynthesis
MRISIDATPLLLRSAGVKNYVYHWIRHMRALSGDGAIFTFPVAGPFRELNHERSILGRSATFGGLAALQFLNFSHLPWRARVDVFHASHQLYNPPRDARLTATIYDMTCWLMPELHMPRNVEAGKRFGERIMRRAAGLIAISESSRQDAIRILGLNPERIAVIYPGISESFFDVGPEEVRAARSRLGLERPYVLFVGTLEPRKNVGGLVEAYLGMKSSLREEYELIVAGPEGWLESAVAKSLRSGAAGVRYLGYVREADLPGLTAGAAVFLYPSLYEGFGFPVAQAMAAGVPVVTSNVSSLPEIAGDGALLADPRSVGEIRGSLERLLLTPGLREELGRAGRARAQQYRWENCAAESLRFFKCVAGV